MKRRFFLASAGMAAVAGTAAPLHVYANPLSMACRGTRRLTVGPYLTPDNALRSDIREGSPGTPLELELEVVDDMFCRPVVGATVEVWQADAKGLYSGVNNVVFDEATLRLTDGAVDMVGKTFLRGHQLTDENGRVRFTTIYPGGYFPRLPHLHVRVQFQGIEWTALDTQLFFPEDVTERVYAQDVYVTGKSRVSLANDLVVKGDRALFDELTVPLKTAGDGYVGRFQIATTSLG